MWISILQHAAHEGPAALADWAAARGHNTKTHPLYADPALPAPDEFDCLIVLGGGMSVHDGGLHPWLEPERALIRAALAAEGR
jgi:GMP synthase-like glutamine amidotransferase